MRVSQGLIALGTVVATSVTVTNAFFLNKQFYPSMVYLSKSNASLAVVYLQSLVLVYFLFQVVRKLFFGDLRAAESEHLSERAWHAVMETCLAFTVFRDDFSPTFVMQFVLLLFVKCLHWLADDRVDLMERSPVITIKFHIRMLAIVALLCAVDSYFVSHAYFMTVVKGPSGHVVFGFEYAVLLTMVVHVVIKYMLHMHDLRSPSPWVGKTVYLLYAELLINVLRCLLHVSLMLIMLKVNTLPLFSIRPFYLSVRSFYKAINDVIMSRAAINAMNNRFPVVTAEELATMDTMCIICREEMTPQSTPKRLPCSHVFHMHCLRSWFQRQQTCPTCRTDILSPRGAARGAAAPRAPDAPQAPLGAPPMPPPNLFPFMAHQFAFPVPQAAAPGVPGADAPRPPLGGGILPPPLGPLPFLPPFVPPAPFPLPPRPSLSGLSEEELRSIEGTSRAAVEARIRLLADISTLMDAAVLQMQQYTRAVSNLPPGFVPTPPAPTPAPTPAESSSTPPVPPPAAAPPTSNGSASPVAQDSSTSSSETPSTSSAVNGSPSSSGSSSVSPSSPVQRGLFTGQNNQNEENQQMNEERNENGDEINEIRQRRLQRFAD